MSVVTSSGRFDGREATFELSETDLKIQCVGLPVQKIDLDTIISITKDGTEEKLSLLYSDTADSWKAGSLHLREHVTQTLPTRLQRLKAADQRNYLPHIVDGQPTRWIIISTGSGTGQALKFFNDVLDPLLSALGWKNFQVLRTSSTSSISDFCHQTIIPQANAGLDQFIIVLAGDGGLVDIVNALFRELDPSTAKIPTIGVIPLGTGNALAHSSGLTGDKTLGLRTLVSGQPKPVPVFVVNFSPGSMLTIDEGRSRENLPNDGVDPENLGILGAVVCSWGLHASLVADSDTAEYRKFGSERFQMAAKELMHPADGSGPHAYRGKVSILQYPKTENKQWTPVGDGEHAYTLMTLASQLDEGFTISPASRPLDGQLRLVHFGPVSADETMRLMGLASQAGKHVEEMHVDYLNIEAMRIDFEETDERWRRVCVDGKIIAVGSGGWLEARIHKPVQVNMLAPV